MILSEHHANTPNTTPNISNAMLNNRRYSVPTMISDSYAYDSETGLALLCESVAHDLTFSCTPGRIASTVSFTLGALDVELLRGNPELAKQVRTAGVQFGTCHKITT